MDNITHILAGAWIGEAAHHLSENNKTTSEGLRQNDTSSQTHGLSRSSRLDGEMTSRRRLYLTASILANNVPDLDLVLSGLLPAPLGYLLHHRGHTHTIGFILIQIAVVFALLLPWPSFRRTLRESSQARRGVLALSIIGLMVHLALDSLNSYGIHPFWPFQSQWVFGDLVFIVEPTLWAAFGVSFAMTTTSVRRRYFLLGLLVIPPILAQISGVITLPSLVGYGLLLAGLAWSVRRFSRQITMAASLSVILAFLVLQAFGREHALEQLRTQRALGAGERELDVVMTASPVNPVCWSFIRISINDTQGTYRLEKGRISAWPDTLTTSCPPVPGGPTHEVEQNTGSTHAFADLALRDCWFDAWLRFARAPLVKESIVTDWRFTRGGDENFTTMRLETSTKSSKRACPGWIPNWGQPRRDLLMDGYRRIDASKELSDEVH